MTKLKRETSIRRGDVSSVWPLIVKFSQETWEKLPSNAKQMHSVEDLKAMGKVHLVTYVAKLYRGKKYKGATILTYAYKSLKNFYRDVLENVYAEKRIARVLSGDAPILNSKDSVTLFDAIALANKYSQEDTMLLRYDAEKAFLDVYAKASSHLRKHLIQWCIQPHATKYKLTNSKFIKARREFREQGFWQILTENLVATIQGDAIARSRITLAIMQTGFRTIRRGRVLERELLPALIDPEDQEFFDISLC